MKESTGTMRRCDEDAVWQIEADGEALALSIADDSIAACHHMTHAEATRLAIALVRALPDQGREEFIRELRETVCFGCGCDQPPFPKRGCQCQNDE